MILQSNKNFVPFKLWVTNPKIWKNIFLENLNYTIVSRENKLAKEKER